MKTFWGCGVFLFMSIFWVRLKETLLGIVCSTLLLLASLLEFDRCPNYFGVEF